MAARKPQRVYQHEPLVTPQRWSGEERQFSIRLTAILDDLYAKYGALKQEQASSDGGGSFDVELPIASETQAGIMKVGSNLKVTADGVVSVDTATEAEEGNSKPITSAAAKAAVDSVNAVLYGKEQNLTDEQKAQARENIGVTSVPFSHSWDGTVLSVTSGSGTTSADLKGPKGDAGATGPQGPKGDTGAAGSPGNDGEDGVGIASVQQTTTSTADGGTNVITVTMTNGTKSTFSVKNGSKGSDGASSAGIAMKLLWKNAKPTSAFAAQTITVSGLNQGAILVIEFQHYAISAFWIPSVVICTLNGATNKYVARYTGENWAYKRDVSINLSTQKITFDNCFINESTTDKDNSSLVPSKMYIVKGAIS